MKILPIYFLLSLLFAVTVKAQNGSIPARHFLLNKAGVALDEYDPVSYFNGKVLKGKKSISSKFNEVTYYFASETNKSTFLKQPEKYVPAYGGWCAYAIGKTGEKVEPDFTNFKIIDGKVNLFYKSFFINTLTEWNKDEKSLNQSAIQNWNTIVKK